MLRRDFLKIAGGGVASFGLSSLFNAGSSNADVGGALNLFTWQGYDLTKPFESWRKERKIEQTVKYINNQFDVVSILKGPGGDQFDVSSANQAYTHLFQRLGIMAPISVEDVPTLAKMYPFFRNSPIWRWADNDPRYNSVPWTWGAIGINYLSDKVEKPTSWNTLLDPKHKGRVGTYDDAFNNVSIAAIALGFDLTKISHAQLSGPIRDWLLMLKTNLKTISLNIGDQQNLLINKEVDLMCVGITLVSNAAKAAGVETVEFTVPSEGGFGFVDAAFVSATAPNKENAFAFCEALLSGETAAAAANEFLQAVVVPSVVPLLSPATRALYPYEDLDNYLANGLKLAVNFTPEEGQDIVTFAEINALWTEIKAS